MRYLEDPRQSELFDVVADILSPVAYRRLTSGRQHVFRQAILKLMPASMLAEHFDPQMGRRTKVPYSMAGPVFIIEFRNSTHDEAADAYMFNIDAQYALNLQPEKQSLCRRTIERYIKLFPGDVPIIFEDRTVSMPVLHSQPELQPRSSLIDFTDDQLTGDSRLRSVQRDVGRRIEKWYPEYKMRSLSSLRDESAFFVIPYEDSKAIELRWPTEYFKTQLSQEIIRYERTGIPQPNKSPTEN